MNRLHAATCLLAITAVGKASAQTTVPVNIGVAERARPEYEQIGGRLGSFILYPRIEASAAYDDNIYAQPDDRTDDFIFTVTPSARLRSQWKRHLLDVGAQFSRNFYAENSSENTSTMQVDGIAGLDVSRQTRIRLTALAGRFTESRTDINSVSGLNAPTQYDRITTRGTLDQNFNNLAIVLDAGIQRLRYSNNNAGALDQSFRDNSLKDASLRVRYDTGAGASAFIQISADQLRYDDKEVVFGGVVNRLERDSDGYRAEIGAAFELTSLIYGDARIGYLHRNSFDPTLRDVSGISFGANVLWNITPLTSVRLVADRSVEDSSSRIVAGNLRSQGTLTVDHELLRNLILNASLRYADVDPIGPVANSQELEANAGASMMLNRRFRVQARYRFYNRASGVLNDFASNRLTLSAAARF